MPSGSTAWAVIPTAVPLAAFSATLLAAAFVSLTAPMGAWFTSVSAIVKFALDVLPSLDQRSAGTGAEAVVYAVTAAEGCSPDLIELRPKGA